MHGLGAETSGAYAFESKVQVVSAFDSVMLISSLQILVSSSGERCGPLLRKASRRSRRALAPGVRAWEEAGAGGVCAAGWVVARGAAVDEDVDVGEKAAGFVEQIGDRHGTEGIGEGEETTHDVLALFERGAAAGQRAVGGAEVLAAFGDAAAFTAVEIEVDAFFDHDEFPPSNKKGSPWRALHGEIPLLLCLG